MMKKSHLVLAGVAAVLILDTSTLSKSKGILPSSTISLTRDEKNSCGGNGANTGCHRTSPILTKVEVTVGQRVLNVNGTTAIGVTATNNAVAGTRGGFCADVTAGVLVPGTNSRTSPAGDAITHQDTFSTGRSWQFNYQATQTGLAELYVAANTVNGNGRADGGDMWNFHSSLVVASLCTPVRLFVNAAGVRETGPGCTDGHGNQSVLGCPDVPSVGNAGFTFEAHGLPPAAKFLLQISIGGNAPAIDMAPMGAPGCFLRTAMHVGVSGVTGGGDAVRAEGKVVLPAPIPNDARLKGTVIDVQVLAMDAASTRALPVVATNGVEVTIQ